MKPIAVIAPSLESGLITAATVVDDVPIARYGNSLKNYYGGYKGLSNIRYMLKISQNTTEAQLLEQLTPIKSIEFLREMGITSLVTKSENAETNDENLSLALGGVTWGITPLEMAAAYACIANDGVYIEPTFYSKIEDSNGDIVLEPEQEERRVLSKENAYIMQSLLTEPISAGGTGTAAKISGMQTCGKTGTTNDDYDGWFCGFTPYYTGATWFGYDYNARVTSSTSTTIWAAIMKDLHKDLENKSFEKPSGVVTASVCKDSGLLATDECKNDPRGSRAYKEYFAKGTAPTDYCSCHVLAEVCKDSGKLAGDDCDDVEEKVFITREDSEEDTTWKKAADAKYMLPTEECEECSDKKAEEAKKKEEEEKKKQEEEKKKAEEEEKKRQEQEQQETTEPTEPEEPTTPTEPTEPEEPTTPTEPTEPEEPTTPTEPSTEDDTTQESTT